LPHSDIPGSQPAGGSPGLIAAIHVLHRLLVPRHPPCALASSASRSLELTKPAGSTFSKKPCLFSRRRPGSGARERPVSVCSTTLRFFRYTQRSCERQSWHFHQDNLTVIRSRRHDWLCNSFLSLPVFTLCSKAQKWPDTVEPLHTRKPSSEPYAVGVSNCLMVRFSWSGMRAHTSQRPVRPAKEHYISLPLNRASHRRPPRSKNLQRPAVRGRIGKVNQVEPRGLEPLTSALQRRRSPS
jgi:hypothetical protein